MADMGLIQAATLSLSAGRQLLKSVFDAKVDEKSTERVHAAMEKFGEAADALYNLREELFRLQDENEKLKSASADFADFKERRAEYTLKKTDGGAVVFAFNSEPAHYACPTCMSNNVIAILQDNRTHRGLYRCTRKECEATFPIDKSRSIGNDSTGGPNA